MSKHLLEMLLADYLKKSKIYVDGDAASVVFELACTKPNFIEQTDVRNVLIKLTGMCPLESSIRFYETLFDRYQESVLWDQKMCALFGALASRAGRLCADADELLVADRTMALLTRLFDLFIRHFEELRSKREACEFIRKLLIGVCGLKAEPDDFYVQPAVDQICAKTKEKLRRLGEVLTSVDLQAACSDKILSPLVTTFTEACARHEPELVTTIILNNIGPIIYIEDRFDFLISDRNAIQFYQTIVGCSRHARTYILDQLTSRFMNNYDMDVANYLLVAAVQAVNCSLELKHMKEPLTSLSVLGTCFRLKFPKALRTIIRKCLQLNINAQELIENLVIVFDCHSPKERRSNFVRCLIELKQHNSLTKSISSVHPDGVGILCDMLAYGGDNRRPPAILRNLLAQGLTELTHQDTVIILKDVQGFTLFQRAFNSPVLADEHVLQDMLAKIPMEVGELLISRPTRTLAFTQIWTMADLSNRFAIVSMLQASKRKSWGTAFGRVIADMVNISEFIKKPLSWLEREKRKLDWQRTCGESVLAENDAAQTLRRNSSKAQLRATAELLSSSIKGSMNDGASSIASCLRVEPLMSKVRPKSANKARKKI